MHPLDTLTYELKGSVAYLTLNRPSRKNAINAQMHDELRLVLDDIEKQQENIRALVLRGANGSFCSGQDLAERAAMLKTGEVDLADSLATNYNPLVRRLIQLPMPVIASVAGYAAGAGAALACCADIVIAAKNARFQLAFAKVGLGADSGISWFLPRLVGNARAMGMALTAEMITAETAMQWGLIWQLVEDTELESATEQMAEQLSRGPQAALRAIKAELHQASELSLEQSLELERDMQGKLGVHPDYREAVTAFMSKKRPNFS